jgi:hypothetical protein
MNRRIFRGMKIGIIGIMAIAIFGEVVLQLWNYVMPGVFGLHPITFWQALGLLALSWILLGRFGGSFERRARRRRQWDEMTPEQREMMRKGLSGGCGRFDQPGDQPAAGAKA